MANIHIFDYEDGIQDFIGQMLIPMIINHLIGIRMGFLNLMN